MKAPFGRFSILLQRAFGPNLNTLSLQVKLCMYINIVVSLLYGVIYCFILAGNELLTPGMFITCKGSCVKITYYAPVRREEKYHAFQSIRDLWCEFQDHQYSCDRALCFRMYIPKQRKRCERKNTERVVKGRIGKKDDV